MAASQAASNLFQRYRIGLVVCTGIAGGLSDDVHLGDVCYSGKVIDIYENNKAVNIEDNDDVLEIQLSPVHYETGGNITRSLNYVRTQPDVKQLYSRWREQQRKSVEDTGIGPVPSRSKKTETIGAPNSFQGALICGMVSKSKKYNQKLKELERRVLAIETEAGAIFRQAKDHSVKAITIRGISDYANADKGTLEADTNRAVRTIAARNAITFIKMQLSNRYFTNQLKLQRAGTQASLALEQNGDKSVIGTDPLDEVAAMVHSQLRELSPEYRLQPKGYRVPAPRVQRHASSESGGRQEYFSPSELREALRIDRKLLISIPRCYPDNSLAWVIAHELLDVELDGEQVVPIVIDGSKLSPPMRGLSRLSMISLQEFEALHGMRPVFIIEGVPLHSDSKIDFLQKEILKREDAHFILLSPHSPNILRQSEFTMEMSVSIYALCDISFMEISNFIQRSFEMSTSQAQVVAKRLWDTFKEFNLSAHPTYFAGIPRETLMALLHANQRAELIQFAVDGFLTIVVVEDQAQIALSRTTRSRFLSDLAEEIHLRGRSLNAVDLVGLVETFASEQDFAIKPLDFVRSFQDKGILHFDDGRVCFSLPFIEQYLLAKRLVDREDLATEYFDIDRKEFNLQVFDLYVELGAHATVKKNVLQAIQSSSKALSPPESEKHILLTNDINPRFISSINRIQTLQKRLSQALVDIQKGKSDIELKQKLLDLSERVRETQAKKIRSEEVSDNRSDAKLDDALKDFWLGVTLLGSGAETLLAQEKRHLASALVELGSNVTHVWTTRVATFNFEEFRGYLLGDEFLTEIQTEIGDGLSLREITSTITSLVDAIEAAVLSHPLRTVLGLLCEQARKPVLAQSLLHSTPVSRIGSLLHAVWLTDVDVDQGKVFLAQANKSLPRVQFLRTCIALHCHTRAFWSHWRKKDRIELLNTADKFLKPFSGSIGSKSETLRTIKKKND